MPDFVIRELWEILPTFVYFLIGLLMFGWTIRLMEKFTPFSIRKEIEEDHNVALGIVVGSALIGIAIILAAVIA
ncbi:MAG: DUF350 domain-containing protein [Planctomycetes bacterium]|nr:DUF350 domain-containing protein [Planctomycetota bacterium]